MRVGIFGGSFDPIHLGHLWIAESARETLALDVVRFVPAYRSPLKENAAAATEKQRIEMLQLAIGGHPNFVLDERELRRGGVSYTVDTLRELQSETPDAELYLIMGADSLNDFERWREPLAICEIATLAVVARGGEALPDWERFLQLTDAETTERMRRASIDVPLVQVSSRELRQRVAEGRSIRYRVPRSVECFIANQGLYRNP